MVNRVNRLAAWILLVLLITPTMSFAVDADDILGSWITEGGDCRVEIIKKDQLYFGRIAALTNPVYHPGEVKGMDGKPRLDLVNPDESLRSRPIIGLELLRDFRFDGEKWVGGDIYDPENGKSYNCKMTVDGDGNLRVRGYVGVSLLGRTTVWARPEVHLEFWLEFLGLENRELCLEKKQP
jgi:uncharacterized protein (DUF2147 family)